MANLDLFMADMPSQLQMSAQAFIFKRLALPVIPQLLVEIDSIARQAPFRHMTTPSGHQMSAAMTNCGQLGWITDQKGYRYSMVDPLTQQPWPVMPAVFLQLAQQAAQLAGFDHYTPDSCLINQYAIGSKLSLHQDKDEQNYSQPIVSVSLGLTATFLWGGQQRREAVQKFILEHGDVVV